MKRREFLVLGSAAAIMPRYASAQAKPLKIGILNDLSSVYSDDQGIGSSIAAKMAVDDWAIKLGVPVDIVIADHQNKPDVGAAIARKWYESDGVDVVMDIPNSAVALAIVALAKDKNKAVIGSGAGSSVLTGPMCSKNFVHWTYDTYSWGTSVGKAVTEEGGKSWYFLTADYAFGKDLEKSCADAVVAAGGTVLGTARHPLNSADFSSFLLSAQASGADVIGLANAGGDMNNALKQAAEFGISKKQRLAGLTINHNNVRALGLPAVQNVKCATGFYWDRNDDTRAFSKRFQDLHAKKNMPTDMQAGMYAATLHLMKAMAQTKSADDGVKLIDTMKALPTDDLLFGKGTIREDGRKLHQMFLLVTKTPEESKGDWDYFKLASTIAPADAWRPLDKGGCPFIKT